MKITCLIFIGGGLGALLRYAISKYASSIYEGLFPLATFFINIMGCFLIGLLAGFFMKNGDNPTWKALLVTGFCGGFTTFSAFSLESITLIQKGENGMVLFYTALSVFLGLLFTYLGMWIVD